MYYNTRVPTDISSVRFWFNLFNILGKLLIFIIIYTFGHDDPKCNIRVFSWTAGT